MKYLGKDFRLRVKIGGVFYTLDGETSTSGTMSREMPDITNKNSMPWRELMPSCGVLSMSMKVSGFTSSSLPVSSIRELFNAAFYGNELQVQMSSLNSDDVFGEGKTIITSLDRSGDKNGAETYNITLESVSPMSSGDAVLKVTIPVFTPYGGYVSPTAFITINDAIVGASIWYTLDGSTPTVGSRLYTAPFSLPSWFGFWSFASATSNITSVVLSGPIPGLPGSIAASTSSGSLSQPGGIYGAASSVAANYTGDITVMCNVSVSGTNSTDSGARWGLIRNLNSGTFDKFTVVVGYHSGVLSVFGYIGTTVLPITYVSSVTTVHVTLRLSDTAWTLFVNGTAVSNGTGVSYDGSSSDVGGYLPPSSGSGDTFFSIDNAGVFKGALSDARIAAIAGGSVPSFVYESSTTAKAFATKVGLIDSDVATAVYNLVNSLIDPTKVIGSYDFGLASYSTANTVTGAPADSFSGPFLGTSVQPIAKLNGYSGYGKTLVSNIFGSAAATGIVTPTTSFTIALFVKCLNITSSEIEIGVSSTNSNPNTSSTASFLLNTTGTSVMKVGVAAGAPAVPTMPVDSAWHHYAVVVNGTYCTIYKDGLIFGLVGTLSSTTSVRIDYLWEYGIMGSNSGMSWDNVFFSTEALTAAAISALAAGHMPNSSGILV